MYDTIVLLTVSFYLCLAIKKLRFQLICDED